MSEEEKIEKIIELAINGLTIDGVHHKQYYLEKILLELSDQEHIRKLKKYSEWEEGIPP